MDNNLNDLMSAANQKLDAQKKQMEQGSAGEQQDIYADMKQEMEQEDDQSIEYTNIQRTPNNNTQYNDFDVQHEPDDEDYDDYYELDPNDTPLFEGGPGLSQIEIWKKEYSKEKVYHTQILDRHFVFRTLNRFEYKQIVSIEQIDALYREELICHTCVLWPLHYDFKKMAVEDSGYPSTLAQIIMENSGFTKEYGIEVL